MFKVVLKEKGHPITKEIRAVKALLFSEYDGKDWLYITFKDNDGLLRSKGVDLTIYDVFEVKGD